MNAIFSSALAGMQAGESQLASVAGNVASGNVGSLANDAAAMMQSKLAIQASETMMATQNAMMGSTLNMLA